MHAIEMWESLLTKSDREIIRMAKDYGVDLTVEEVRGLRPLAEQANITWLVKGIPDYILYEAEKVLGTKKFKKYKKMLDSYY